MPTINQLIRRPRKDRLKKKSTDLDGNSQLRGVVLRVYVVKPRKPNSAFRAVARVRLTNGKEVTVYVPGEGGRATLQEHSVVLVRGGGPKDLSGVYHSVIRGVHDARPVYDRRSSRSRYGMTRPK